jgi:hypothetical protein
MNRITVGRRPLAIGVAVAALCAAGLVTGAASAQVNTVPANPNAPLQNHDIISGRATTLKAAAAESLVGDDWAWNPGDGSAGCNGSATSGNIDPTPTPAQVALLDDVGFNPYWAVWCQHTYTGNDGDVFIATVTVDTNGSAGGPFTAQYRMEVRANTLPAEVNASIDEALWHMHRNQTRFNGAVTQSFQSTTAGAIPMGMWDFPQKSGTPQISAAGAAVNAFEANGYLETGPATSPYTDTVRRGLKYVIAGLFTQPISLQHWDRPPGTGGASPLTGDDPDVNANGIGIGVNGTDPPYQGGMVMDAIIASGTPGTIATTGPANVIGRSYGAIIQDMVDYYAWAQGDGLSAAGASTGGGGWRYGPWDNTTGQTDNSTNGWAGIGLVAAEDLFGSTVPQWVKDRNITALELTDIESATADTDGEHGYTNAPGPVWGPWGVTGAAMVQMAMDGILATTSATPDERWIRAENYFRRHFNDAVAGANFKNYYYGMFNFTKAMRTAKPSPVIVIGANNSVGCGPNNGVPGCSATLAPLDWYNHATQGLARTVVDYQVKTGVNIGMFASHGGVSGGNHFDHENQWATQILTRALFQAGPIARAEANPNPGAENSPIAFDPSGSFHQDPARQIAQYEWDFDNNGTFDVSTPGPSIVMQSFACPPPGVPCTRPVTLRVTDNNVPALTAIDVVNVQLTVPPHPPVADADGPYMVCTVGETLTLNGAGSFDIDAGTSQSGNPPFDAIIAYEWDLNLASGGPFDVIGAMGVSPVVAPPVGHTDIALRVRDNTALAFPISGQPNLTDTDATTVEGGDCGCFANFAVRPKATKNQLTWSPVAGAASYDILRSTTGPNADFSVIAASHVSSFATYLDENLANGTTYWYRVVPNAAPEQQVCDFSRAASGTPNARFR